MPLQKRLKHETTTQRQVQIIQPDKHFVNTGCVQPLRKRVKCTSSFQQQHYRHTPIHHFTKSLYLPRLSEHWQHQQISALRQYFIDLVFAYLWIVQLVRINPDHQ